MKRHIYYFLIALFITTLCNICLSGAEEARESLAANLDSAKLYLNINLDIARNYVDSAIEKSRNLNDEISKGIAYTYLGYIGMKRGQYLEALEYLNIARNILEEQKSANNLAYLNYVSGLFYNSIYKNKDAMEYGLKALNYYEEINDSIQMARIYTFFGGLYSSLLDYRKSLEYIYKSFDIHSRLSDTASLSGDLGNLGLCFFKNKLYDSANYYLDRAVLLNTAKRNNQWLAVNYHIKGMVTEELQKYEDAMFFYNLSLDKFMEVGDKDGELSVRNKIGRYFYNKKYYKKSLEYYKIVLTEANRFGSLRNQATALKGVCSSYKMLGRYREAYDYLEKYQNLNDSIDEKQNESIVSVLELQNEYEKNKNSLIIENQKVRIDSEQKGRFIILMVGLLVLLLLIIFIIFKQKKHNQLFSRLEKENLEKEISLKNKELTLSLINRAKLNETMESIIAKLKDFQLNMVTAQKLKLNGIINDINKEKDEGVWEEFEIRFKSVHNDYYDKLKEKAPDLTPSELKICAFLKLNMNTKEISSLLFKSQSSIEVDRARIRKKLGITNQKINLVSFLMEL